MHLPRFGTSIAFTDAAYSGLKRESNAKHADQTVAYAEQEVARQLGHLQSLEIQVDRIVKTHPGSRAVTTFDEIRLSGNPRDREQAQITEVFTRFKAWPRFVDEIIAMASDFQQIYDIH